MRSSFRASQRDLLGLPHVPGRGFFVEKSMNAKITNKIVRKVADLIKIKIPEADLDVYRSNLKTAIDAVDTLAELETERIKETAQTIGTENILRKDEVGVSLSQDEALLNAAKTYKGYFSVKKVFHDQE